jgi:hypothetical protein
MTVRDRIEFNEPKQSLCECCGQTSTHLVRYVSRDGQAFAVYFADFSTGHDYVNVLASFGDWVSDEGAEHRTAFALAIWVRDGGYQVGCIDAGESGYESNGVMGRILDRAEALEHPLKQEAFDLSDHIVECDRPVIEFLERLA